jgi:hypothetical protein
MKTFPDRMLPRLFTVLESHGTECPTYRFVGIKRQVNYGSNPREEAGGYLFKGRYAYVVRFQTKARVEEAIMCMDETHWQSWSRRYPEHFEGVEVECPFYTTASGRIRA